MPSEPTRPSASSVTLLWRRWLVFSEKLGPRNLWWSFLNAWERRPAFRLGVLLSLLALVLAAAAATWLYPWWLRRNSLRFAHEWLAAGKYVYAAEAAVRAAELNPTDPQPWLVMAELARRGGQADRALESSRRAAELAPDNPEVVITWASDALRADRPEEARRALKSVSAEATANSSHAARIRGELARRELRLTEAQEQFELAARLEGPQAINQIPLGLVLLQSATPATRAQGRTLLNRWRADPAWGATALRTLLDDALQRDQASELPRLARELRAHPAFATADMPRYLRALARADEPAFNAVVSELERDYAVSPAAATQLVNWLNQLGRSAEALRWLATLPAPAQQQPPLAPVIAEALRLTGNWRQLADAADRQSWGPEQDFLRWSYATLAYRQLGEEMPASQAWSTLLNHAQENPGRGYFAGSSFYVWGQPREAIELWSIAAAQPGPNALAALGAMARHYQVEGDAEGLYRTFRQLRLLRPDDRSILNNHAFYALLLGRDDSQVEKAVRANFAAEPDNDAYRATLAFALVRRTNDAAAALKLLEPAQARFGTSPALGFAQGIALAANRRRTEAAGLLRALPDSTLTVQEKALIEDLLRER